MYRADTQTSVLTTVKTLVCVMTGQGSLTALFGEEMPCAPPHGALVFFLLSLKKPNRTENLELIRLGMEQLKKEQTEAKKAQKNKPTQTEPEE